MGHLMGLSVFSQGDAMGPFYNPSLKPVCLKVTSMVCSFQEKRRSWEGCYELESIGGIRELEVWRLLIGGALLRQKGWWVVVTRRALLPPAGTVRQSKVQVPARSSPSLPVGSA